ncbi:MAG: hypothetical protein DRR19_14180 [Candidatus Parabeggiatoa sp. nov. 1]|nr:MAG: hypothetical protein DRR19_14180 [Gammaproteobacteria bacterium]
MTDHTVTLTLPEPIYQHLRSQAQTRPLNEVVFQILSQSLPPEVEEDLPFNSRIELESMARLSDDVLWQIAQSTMNQDKVALYDILLARHKTEKLTLRSRRSYVVGDLSPFRAWRTHPTLAVGRRWHF